MLVNVLRQQLRGFRIVEVDDLDPERSQPVEASGEVSALSDDQRADVELADKSAAVPAWGEGRHHDGVTIRPLPTGVSEGVGFGVGGGVAVLDAAVVAGAEEPSVGVEERCADGDSPFGEAEACFMDSDGEHLA